MPGELAVDVRAERAESDDAHLLVVRRVLGLDGVVTIRATARSSSRSMGRGVCPLMSPPTSVSTWADRALIEAPRWVPTEWTAGDLR